MKCWYIKTAIYLFTPKFMSTSLIATMSPASSTAREEEWAVKQPAKGLPKPLKIQPQVTK